VSLLPTWSNILEIPNEENDTFIPLLKQYGMSDLLEKVKKPRKRVKP
jgi:hypothetical protein